MKTPASILAIPLLALAWNVNALVTVTVNTSVGGDDPGDGALSFTEAVMLLNSNAPTANSYSLARSLSPSEHAQVVGTNYSSAVIRFAIPGPGPHYIQVPPEGFPKLYFGELLIDGFSQAGASPNSNPISGTNNAALKIVLDCRVPAGNNVRSFLSADGIDWSVETGERLKADADEQITDPSVIPWRGGWKMYFKASPARAGPPRPEPKEQAADRDEE